MSRPSFVEVRTVVQGGILEDPADEPRGAAAAQVTNNAAPPRIDRP